MSAYNICFRREIGKNTNTYWMKKVPYLEIRDWISAGSLCTELVCCYLQLSFTLILLSDSVFYFQEMSVRKACVSTTWGSCRQRLTGYFSGWRHSTRLAFVASLTGWIMSPHEDVEQSKKWKHCFYGLNDFWVGARPTYPNCPQYYSLPHVTASNAW